MKTNIQAEAHFVLLLGFVVSVSKQRYSRLIYSANLLTDSNLVYGLLRSQRRHLHTYVCMYTGCLRLDCKVNKRFCFHLLDV